LQNRKRLVLVLILTVLASFNLYALVLRRSPVPSASAVQAGVNVGVYWDQSCTQSIDSISWGTLQVGGTQEVDVYVRNEGNDTFNLALTAQDWQPGNAYLWLTFSWSCGSTTVGPGQVVQVTLTLSVASGFSGGFSGFSFDIVLEGTPIVLTGEGASAVQAGAGIGVYWDAGCTQSVDSINWGSLINGGTEDIVMYVRNEGNDTSILELATRDWQPGNAYLWLNFSWSCGSITIGPGQVVQVTLALSVASSFSGGFSGFSFSIVFEGTLHFLGDINKDGVVDQQDLAILVAAYGSTSGDPQWNAEADLNSDGIINLLDLLLLGRDWGKTSIG
jgi:uncharacterized protein (DUF2237 family)